MIVVFVFILGLFIGSFLNVVILRLHRQESFVKGASKCLFCGHRLYPKDLVPFFSYFYLKGRCRYCKQKFSSQYPLMELATAIIFSLIFLNIAPNGDIALLGLKEIVQIFNWWALAGFLLIIFVYDLKYYLILDNVIWPALVLAIVVNLFLGFAWLDLLLAMVIGGGFFLVQFVISKGRWIGGGDIRLGLLMGAILGYPHILTALFIAYVLGSLLSVWLLLASRKGWKDKVPFGTFLTLATWLTMLYGQELVNWYWSLFL